MQFSFVTGYLYNFQTKELYNLNYQQEFVSVSQGIEGTYFGFDAVLRAINCCVQLLIFLFHGVSTNCIETDTVC